MQQVDIYDFVGIDKRADDLVYGGAPGMVLSSEVVFQAILHAKTICDNAPVIFMSPRGKTLSNSVAKELSSFSSLILLCGHYEGIDERVIVNHVDMEISIGNFILSNGCLPALVCIDGISRFCHGVVGDINSVYRDSFESCGSISPSVYTRPVVDSNGDKVPSVIVSGHHNRVAIWNKVSSLVNSVIKVWNEEFLMNKDIDIYANVNLKDYIYDIKNISVFDKIVCVVGNYHDQLCYLGFEESLIQVLYNVANYVIEMSGKNLDVRYEDIEDIACCNGETVDSTIVLFSWIESIYRL